MGFHFPESFIDKEGIIQYYTVNNLLCGRSVDASYFTINSIYKENPGQACPVDWKYGDKILI
jgi:peroxiredoxin (alkyl hydroperoxide reductase subunit C)